MLFRGLRLLAAAALTAISTSFAAAAPPASCAYKFIGTWVYPGGVTTVAPNGMAYPKCPMCVPTQTWTCSGNNYLFSNSGPPGQFTATLVAPNTLQYGGGTATRVGGGGKAPQQKTADSEAGAAPAKPKQTAKIEKPKPSRQSCSDITGTKGGPSRAECPEPTPKKLTVAPPPPPQKAAGTPGKPEDAPNAAPTADQQAALAGNIIDELGRARSGQVSSASQPVPDAPQQPAFDLATADPYRAAPPPPAPQAAQSCVGYFENMRANFKRNAALCLKDSVLLLSLTDMVEKAESTTDERLLRVNRNSAPELFAQFDPIDPRWNVSGDTAAPNCDLPLTVGTQREAFMECARVYLCGMRAATCGLNVAQEKASNDCVPISRACIAKNPVPQRMVATPSPPPYQPREQQIPPLPASPRNNSTITGPSGPGGGDTGGGVRSAQ